MRWKNPVSKRQRVGEKVSPKPNNKGYRRVKLNGQDYLEHRVIYKMMTGKEPPVQLDHKNQGRATNKIDNLRPGTHGRNNQNITSRGYSWCKKAKKWRSTITTNYKIVWIGYFDTEKEAFDSYRTMKFILHPYSQPNHEPGFVYRQYKFAGEFVYWFNQMVDALKRGYTKDDPIVQMLVKQAADDFSRMNEL